MGARESRVRRSDEAEQIAPPAAEPVVPEQREQSPAERGLRQPDRPVERVGHADRAERRFERRAHALEKGADDEDLARRRAGPEKLENLVGDQLQCRPRPRTLEEADRALGRRRRRRVVLEHRPFEVGERRVGVVGVAGRQLLDLPVGKPGEVGRRALERREGEPARLVLERDGDVDPSGERLQQPPLRAAQILEAVRVYRPSVPCVELAREPIGGVGASEVAVPEREPVELLAIAAVQLGQVAVEVVRCQQPRLELSDRTRERVGEAREAGGRLEILEPGTRHHSAQEQHPLRLADERTRRAVHGRDQVEDVVERPDQSAEQRAPPGQQVPLDSLDVRPRRHDQHRLAAEIRQVAVEE
jgi:hypothetical protein